MSCFRPFLSSNLVRKFGGGVSFAYLKEPKLEQRVTFEDLKT
jgi:hypothetical protein